jgi:hypothetical protein
MKAYNRTIALFLTRMATFGLEGQWWMNCEGTGSGRRLVVINTCTTDNAASYLFTLFLIVVALENLETSQQLLIFNLLYIYYQIFLMFL